MTLGFTDYTDMGILPCQDHESQVPISIRQMMVGGRVAFKQEIGTDGAEARPMEFATEGGLGTLGDVHPWGFWQTASPGVRGMGSWSMAWSGVVQDGARGGFGTGRSTGTKVEASLVVPQRGSSSKGILLDGRYVRKAPAWTPCFSNLPQGTQVMVMPGTSEGSQADILMHADNRLIAVHTDKAAECGTLVCDLQPEGEICMDGAETPGVGGRHARLQSAWRVIPMPDELPNGALKLGKGNAIAINGAKAGIDEIPGYAMMFGRFDTVTQTRGPVTHVAKKGGSKGSTCAFGKFDKKPAAGHGSGFMAQGEAFGPLSVGDGGCKHNFGADEDGNPINSGHLSKNAYWFYNAQKDGPLHFEDGEYPNIQAQKLTSLVHFVWDDRLQHPWSGGTLPGKWRWYAESSVVKPDTTTSTPSVVLPPIGGGGGNGGSVKNIRASVIGTVGEIAPETSSLYTLFHPMSEGFVEINFRPQLMVKGFREYTHNPDAERREFLNDEQTRPQVVALRSWGAQNASAAWDYEVRPDVSRARGGTASGGVLFTPPSLELSDYFSINSSQTVYGAATTSLVTCAPGVAFAWGRPTTAGTLDVGGIVARQDPTDTTDDPLQIAQFNSAGTLVDLMTARVSQSDGEARVSFSGTHSVRIPYGATGDQPTTPVNGDLRVNSTDGVLEFYDGAWIQVTSTP